MNDQTRWTWERLWPLEDAFWNAAPAALGVAAARPILAQAARELLLAQASDWQFILSTGAVPDYAERRFTGHCQDAERLLAGLHHRRPRGRDAARRRVGAPGRGVSRRARVRAEALRAPAGVPG